MDSLEVRWIVPGLLRTAMREWFARFPAGTERREDTYLLQPRLRGLSVKLRNRSALDVKAHLGNPVVPGLPVRGRLESWRKWSFPYAPQDLAGATPAGWITVRKQRHSSWFPLTTMQDPVPAPRDAARPGCAVEVTEVHVRGERWWTVGFEATGPADLLPDAVRHAADRVFAQPLPAGVELSLDNSRSYTQWLHERPSPGSGDTTSPPLSRPLPVTALLSKATPSSNHGYRRPGVPPTDAFRQRNDHPLSAASDQALACNSAAITSVGEAASLIAGVLTMSFLLLPYRDPSHRGGIVAAETEMVILPQRLPRGARATLADTRIPGDHILAPLGVRRLDRRAAFRPSCLDSSGDDVAVESSAVLTVGETKVGLASERITGAFCRLVA